MTEKDRIEEDWKTRSVWDDLRKYGHMYDQKQNRAHVRSLRLDIPYAVWTATWRCDSDGPATLSDRQAVAADAEAAVARLVAKLKDAVER